MQPFYLTYDFAIHPASWDFLNWLIINEAARRGVPDAGPLCIRFKAGPDAGFRNDGAPRPRSAKEAIFRNVIRPSLRLLDVEEDTEPWSVPSHPSFIHLMRNMVAAHKMGLEVPKWKVPQEIAAEMRDYLKGRKPVVITLREASYWPKRNSRVDDWITFAKRCKEDIVFVRDTEKADEPLEGFETNPRAARDLLWRAALAAEAKANLSVYSGPPAISQFMDPPWLMFGVLTPDIPDYRPGTPQWWKSKHGVSVGSQYPWCTPKQRIVWEKDTLPAIEAAWADLNLNA